MGTYDLYIYTRGMSRDVCHIPLCVLVDERYCMGEEFMELGYGFGRSLWVGCRKGCERGWRLGGSGGVGISWTTFWLVTTRAKEF